MEFWERTSLTAGRRPILLPGERTLQIQKDVGLYHGDTRLHTHDSGLAYVTTHRVIWIDEPTATGLALRLPTVLSIATTGGFAMPGFVPAASMLKSSPKVILTLRRETEGPRNPIAVAAGNVSTSSSVATSRSSLPEPPRAAVAASRVWVCTICDARNPEGDAQCDTCGVRRAPEAKVVVESGGAAGGDASTTAAAPAPSEPLPPAPQVEDGKTCPVCTFVNHPIMVVCEMCEAPLPDAVSTDISSAAGSAMGSTSTVGVPEFETAVVKLSFRSGGQGEFLKILKTAMADKEWEKATGNSVASPAQSPIIPAARTLGGGIAGIMRNVDNSIKSTDVSLSQAFTDLDALMGKAGEMVKLAETISQRLAQTPLNSVEDTPEISAFRSYLVNLGISTPVTKELAGDLYAQELSRELAEFLDRVLNEIRTMIPLVDLYCMFNRARGVALVSPGDLEKSTELFETLKLPFRLRKFDSGLLVVQSVTNNDDAVAARVLGRVKTVETQGKGGVTAVDLASLERISVILAREHLLLAESKGLLCRDDTVEGLKFFDNII